MDERSSAEKLLEDLELTLLRPDIRKSNRTADLLADDFIEFGSSGRVFTKADVIVSLQAEPSAKITASALKVKLLAPHLALVTYRTCCQGEPLVHSLRSSIWEQKRGSWQMVFHQGTPRRHKNRLRRPRTMAAAPLLFIKVFGGRGDFATLRLHHRAVFAPQAAPV